MIEYQIVLNVYLPQNGGRTIKQVVKYSERESAISAFKYLSELGTNKNTREMTEWAQENLAQPGQIVGTDGLFCVVRVKILP
jgi:hypothetical protein